ncbi:MAG: hypothetical protein SNJ29_10600 [Rikenellaceae bacterium]
MKIATEHKILINNYKKMREDAFFCENPDELKSEIERLVKEGYDRFITGLIELFDVNAVEAIQQCQGSYPDVAFITVIRPEQLAKRFSPNLRQRANDVVSNAEAVIFTSNEFHSKAFYLPHPYLTDTLKLSVVYYNPLGDGGTMYAYKSKEIKSIPLLQAFDQTNPDSPFLRA